MRWSNPRTRRANGRSHRRLSKGERSAAAVGRGGSRSAPARTSTSAPPSSTRTRSRTPSATRASIVRPDARRPAADAPVLHDPRLGQRASRPNGAERELSHRASPRPARARRAPRAGSTRSARSYERWNPLTRPAITSSPEFQSASSMIFAGFQFHIPPPPCAVEVARRRAGRARGPPRAPRRRARDAGRSRRHATGGASSSARGRAATPRPG